MISAIKQFFEKSLMPQDGRGNDPEHALQLATAALMIEMMRMDDEISQPERQKASRIMQAKFSLSETETNDLMKLAEQETDKSADYHQFTSLINLHFSMAEKEKIVEYLWEIAYADNSLDKHEEYLVRKVADLIGVSHRAFIAAKHQAKASTL